MAILGYDTVSLLNSSGLTAGRMYVSKYNLAAPATLTELHGWFGTSGSGNIEIAQAGFSVPLAAGDYWIGFHCVSDSGNGTDRIVIYADSAGSPGTRIAYTNGYGVGGASDAYANSGGIHKGLISSASDPPPNPFGTPDTSGTRKHSCWAVVVASSTTWNGSSTVSLTDTVTTAGKKITGGASVVSMAATVTTAGTRLAAPTADFSGTPTSGYVPLTVVFTDLSTP